MRYKPMKYCKVEGCNNPTELRVNFCKAHYLENKRSRYHTKYKFSGAYKKKTWDISVSMGQQLREERQKLGFIQEKESRSTY